MSAHTTGPWNIRDDEEDGVVSIVGSSQIVIARVRTATVEPGDENARLIAAAPDLLEALQLLLIVVDAPDDDPDIVRAKNAVAKATGEPQ